MSKKPSRYWVDANIKRLKTHDIVRVEMTRETRERLNIYKVAYGLANYDETVNILLDIANETCNTAN